PDSPGALAASAAEARTARKDLARIERRLAKLTERAAVLHEALAEQATDYVAVGTLTAELREVEREHTAFEEEWLVTAQIVG
ncbi:MAG: ABC transporter ATP-binding protein, partial [Actinomycetales bacterium]|nr:ABC transporter ATP-binding protein [Actinomycetales bacterium]